MKYRINRRTGDRISEIGLSSAYLCDADMDAAVRALRKALPDCKVDDTSYSTLGGWREHPRYDTIYEMFWGTEYIPFTTLD